MLHVDLNGKTALVTGGSGEIGRAICLELARAGARVAFTYFSNHDGADETAAALKAIRDEDPPVVRVNLSHKTAVAEVADAVREQLGSVDIYVANAASGVLKPVTELTRKHWDWTFGVNARAMFFLAQALVAGDEPLMGSGGRVVGLSSLGAQRAIPQYTMVGASKAAMESVSRNLALELGPRGITVNVVAPGVIDTWALQQFPNREQLLQIAQLKTPTGRLCTAADVASTVLFLCADEAGMIHGQTLTVDGGYAITA